MATAIRQKNLFVAEDWRVIYRAFTEINFTAYDFDTIRNAMIDYIRVNFPEDFNDWIESSEFLAIIELLAYLGQSLAFRIDLNTRENFIDTAERRESVLRLARMLSYNPSRNRNSIGLVKVVQMSTNQPLIDSNGTNLSNRSVRWNDANNPDWYEQFILIMNAVFNSTNQFGNPSKDGTVGGVRTQLYSLNNDPASNKVFPFSASVSTGETLPFEIVNPDFNSGEIFYEREPDPLESFNMIYRNDGRGNGSTKTGFFLMFKQGSLRNEDYRLDTPLENRILNLSGSNINNNDVFVHEIDERGFIINKWKKVPALVGSNIIYNSLDKNERNIFSAVTREGDQVSIRFADGRFGNVPTGFIRTWYRESAGTRYVIKPENMRNIRLDIPYFSGVDNNLYFVSFTFALQESVSNSSPAQSSFDIKQNAPQAYYTQNRMVNGEDYNVFPLRNPEAAKIKAVNRIYSGFNRYIDINDPTGAAQNINLFAEDGIIYIENNDLLSELSLPTQLSDSEIISLYINPLLESLDKKQFYYFYYDRYTVSALYPTPFDQRNPKTFVYWINATQSINSSSGRFFIGPNVPNPGDSAIPVKIGASVGLPDTRYYMEEGALIKFNKAGWVTISTIIGQGDTILTDGTGSVVLSEPVDDDDYVTCVIPPFYTNLTDPVITAVKAQINQKNSFGLRYDRGALAWRIITGDNLPTNVDDPFSFQYAGDTSGLNRDNSWLIRVQYSPTNMRFISRGLDYVFESDKQVRFYYSSSEKTIDPLTGRLNQDFVKVMSVNNSVVNDIDLYGSYKMTYKSGDQFTINGTTITTPLNQITGTIGASTVGGNYIKINGTSLLLTVGTVADAVSVITTAVSGNEVFPKVTATNESGALRIASTNTVNIKAPNSNATVAFNSTIVINDKVVQFIFGGPTTTTLPDIVTSINFVFPGMASSVNNGLNNYLVLTSNDTISLLEGNSTSLTSGLGLLPGLYNNDFVLEQDNTTGNTLTDFGLTTEDELTVSHVDSLVSVINKALINPPVKASNVDGSLKLELLNIYDKTGSLNPSYSHSDTIKINDTTVLLNVGTTVADLVNIINSAGIEGVAASNFNGAVRLSSSSPIYISGTNTLGLPTTIAEPKIIIGEITPDVLKYIGIEAGTYTGLSVAGKCAALSNNFIWNINSIYKESDGYEDPKRLKITFTDTDQDGIPDDPTLFESISGLNDAIFSNSLPNEIIDESELFWEAYTNNDGFQEYRLSNKIVKAFNTMPAYFDDTLENNQPDSITPSIFQTTFNVDPFELTDGSIIYFRDTGRFYLANINTLSNIDNFVNVTSLYYYRRGRKNLYFQWKHYSPITNRIDPAITNIIDTYALTVTYDTQIRQWILDDGEQDEKPLPPTTDDLRNLFSDEAQYKMVSDEIIWHPVKYKILFGRQAEDTLQAKFKVTKVNGTTVSDGEIKSRVIDSINNYFSINNFDFGETFYFTELAAYIHQQLATVISSIVLVPLDEEQNFGDLFQVRSSPDEVFISSAKVSDVQIVNSFNNDILRIGN